METLIQTESQPVQLAYADARPRAGGRLLLNYGVLSIAEGLSKLLTFAALAYLARVLGPGGFSDIEFAANVLMCAGMLVDLGFGPYGAREIARQPERTAALVAEIITMRGAVALGAYAVIAAVAIWFAPTAMAGRLLLIYGLCLFAMPWLLQWVFQGHDSMAVVAAANLMRQAAYAAVVFLFARAANGAYVAGIAEISGVVCAAIICTVVCVRRFHVAPFRAGRISAHLLMDGGAIGLSQVFWAVRMYGCVVLIKYVASAEDAGYFAGASRILLAAHTFVWLYFFNLLATMTRAWQSGREEFAALIRRSMNVVVWTCAAAGVLWVFSAPAAAPLAYGKQFGPAAAPLQWFAGVCIAAAINGHYRFGLIAAGRQGVEMLIQCVAACVAVAGILVGNRIAGLSGAAAGLLLSEMLIWLAAWLCSRALLGVRGECPMLLKPALAAGLAVLVGLLLPATAHWVRAFGAAAIVLAAALIVDATIRARLVGCFGIRKVPA